MKDGLKNIKSMTDEIDELTSIQEILKMAIKKEDSAHTFYMVAHNCACHPVDKELLLRLAQEELLHKQNLQRQLEEVKARIFTDQALSCGEFGGAEEP